MSSSDSDDDCYGNVAKKLQSLKAKYVPQKLDDVIVKDSNSDLFDKKSVVPSVVLLDDYSTSVNSAENDELSLDDIIARNAKPKRGRKRNIVNDIEPIYERETRSRRKTALSVQQTVNNTNLNDVNEITEQECCSGASKRGRRGKSRTNTSIRGRGSNANSTRGRGRGRGRNLRGTTVPSLYPIFNIGNFDYYPDTCYNQELFSNKRTEINKDVDVIEDDSLENDNEELSVKVYWQNTQVFRFKIRRYQKFTQIYKYFSEKENVSGSNLLFMYNDKIIKIDDTPDTINYNIAKFIDGGIVNQDVTKLSNQNSVGNLNMQTNDGYKIKFQCQSLKKPFETMAQPDDKLVTAMILCAEHLEVPIERLKFYFDGDLISGKKTPQELDLESGDCIDVKIIS